MAEVFGLDFGTTNSLAARVVRRDGAGARAVTYVHEGRPHPSVVLYRGDQVVVGRAAKDQLATVGAGVVGDAVVSPKAQLGRDQPFHVAGASRTPREVVAEILRHVYQDACDQSELTFDEAVVTIPVNMGGRGRRDLRRAAADAGFSIRQFVHEPLAALYAYLRESQDWERRVAELEGKLMLVVDWGGGTLDLTLCQLVDGTVMQLHNSGDSRVGGDVFDDRLRHLVRNGHAKEHGLDVLDPQPGAEAKLVASCEQAKITLSDAADAQVDVLNYLTAERGRHVEVTVSRDDLERLTEDLVLQGLASIDRVLDRGGIEAASLELVLATGGMMGMPVIHHRLRERFGPARVPKVEHGDRLIAKGAAWVAHDERMVRLSKPFEVLLASDSPATLIPETVDLPTRGTQAPYSFGFHCVDPRDGVARFQFLRAVRPGHVQPTDPRIPYCTLFLPVDPSARPLGERLTVQVMIDDDLVAHVSASSDLVRERAEAEIHGLEFGLSLRDLA